MQLLLAKQLCLKQLAPLSSDASSVLAERWERSQAGPFYISWTLTLYVQTSWQYTRVMLPLKGDCHSVTRPRYKSQLIMPPCSVILVKCKSRQDLVLFCFRKAEYGLGCFAVLCFAVLCFAVLWYAVTMSSFVSNSCQLQWNNPMR